MHDPRADMLANRLVKVARHRRKWARRADVACYRLYDRDIPEIPLIIDWYDGRLYVAEYVRGEPLAGKMMDLYVQVAGGGNAEPEPIT